MPPPSNVKWRLLLRCPLGAQMDRIKYRCRVEGGRSKVWWMLRWAALAIDTSSEWNIKLRILRIFGIHHEYLIKDEEHAVRHLYREGAGEGGEVEWGGGIPLRWRWRRGARNGWMRWMTVHGGWSSNALGNESSLNGRAGWLTGFVLVWCQGNRLSSTKVWGCLPGGYDSKVRALLLLLRNKWCRYIIGQKLNI